MDCCQAESWEPPSAQQKERALVSAIWSSIEQLLLLPDDSAVRHLAASLPPVESLALGDLPVLAKLHLSSATSMMATILKLAPAAFGTSSGVSISASTDIERLAELSTAEGALVAALIDLQLFHLKRAAALTAHSRQRLAQQHCSRSSCSSNSSCSDA